MTTKRKLTKKPIENIWSDYNWSVMYGELKKGPGRSRRIKPLFQYVGEKIPFDALVKIEKKLKELGVEKGGVYIAHDSMGTARYVGRGNIFTRLKQHKKKYPNELVYFSFFVVKDKQHEREVETLLIRGAGPLLEFNQKKKVWEYLQVMYRTTNQERITLSVKRIKGLKHDKGWNHR